MVFAFVFFLFHQELKAEELQPKQNLSLYHVDPVVDGTIIGITSFISIYDYSKSENFINTRCPCDPSEVNSFDRSAIGNNNDFLDYFSDVSVAAAVIFPVALDWYDVGYSKEFGEDMAILAESLSLNGGLVTLAKYSAQRPLPRTYAGDPSLIAEPRGYRSFYSGHTSLTFAALTTGAYTYTLRHPDTRWPWYLAALVGTSVAFERVAAGKHFPSDVIVGALVGTAVGISVPYFHKREDFKNQTFGILPFDDGIYVQWKMRY